MSGLMTMSMSDGVTSVCFSSSTTAEMSRKLEEREVTISQLQRSKNSFGQNAEELKKQLDEENKVGGTSLHELKFSQSDKQADLGISSPKNHAPKRKKKQSTLCDVINGTENFTRHPARCWLSLLTPPLFFLPPTNRLVPAGSCKKRDKHR